MLVNPDDAGINHLDLAVVRLDDGIHELVPDAGFPPPIEAVVDRRAGSVAFGQIAPRRARAQYPEDAIQDAPVVDPGHATRLVRQQRLDQTPLEVGEIIPRHDPISFRSLNHVPGDLGILYEYTT